MNRSVDPRLLLAMVCAAALASAGCSGLARAVGASKVSPDEFRVVTKAPLALPPEFNVRPPTPGEARPQELEASAAARRAVLGEQYARRASNAEQLLVAKAGAAQADPVIRQRIDLEAGGIVRKSADFSDRLLFWRGDEAAPGALDAEAEARRLRVVEAVTGEGAEVTIDRRTGLKLPGL